MRFVDGAMEEVDLIADSAAFAAGALFAGALVIGLAPGELADGSRSEGWSAV